MVEHDTGGEDRSVSRREVLQTAGAIGALGGVSGLTAAGGSRDEFNVGVAADAPRAERAAKQAAGSVRKTIDRGSQGGVVVGQFSATARENLARNPNADYVEPNYTAEKLAVGIDGDRHRRRLRVRLPVDLRP